ncbi:MAG: DUF3244 domain-containing protein [Bacteroidaceae bacterium]|nr:DUF3244 domain-containing protein [Bacteroidaceae bacterium]
MEKRIKILLSLLFILAGQIAVAENNIHLVPNDPLPDPNEEGRSLAQEIRAVLDSQILSVTYSEFISSQITVSDSNNQTVFYQSYNASYSVQANLSSLPSGNYTLYVYAYGVWWHGAFAIE